MDIAGLNDTSGTFIELLITFVLHKLLHEKLSRVKILLPIPINNLQDQRGQLFRELFRTVWLLIQGALDVKPAVGQTYEEAVGNQLEYLSDTLKLIITFVKPVQPDDEGFDMDVNKELVTELLKNELEEERKEFDQFNTSQTEDGAINNDKIQQSVSRSDSKSVNVIDKFIEKLVDTLVVFDPLDRDISGLEGENDELENIAIKRDDLLSQIFEMKTVNSNQLYAPLTKQAQFNLMKEFEE